ncbi:MAG: hypothetical protein WC455_10090 [Dehalococcoidia bacterium]|jgi:photosystem II stability/assembly factor-like uncharacterized protein
MSIANDFTDLMIKKTSLLLDERKLKDIESPQLQKEEDDGVIVSDNYVKGRQGFMLDRRTGDVDLDGVTFNVDDVTGEVTVDVEGVAVGATTEIDLKAADGVDISAVQPIPDGKVEVTIGTSATNSSIEQLLATNDIDVVPIDATTPGTLNFQDLAAVPHSVVLRSPSTNDGTVYVLPAAKGTTGDYLKMTLTGGRAYMSWDDAGSGSSDGGFYVQRKIVDWADSVAVGDGQFYFRVPEGLDGSQFFYPWARVNTAGVTGDMTVQIYNVTQGGYVLSTPLTIADGAVDSSTYGIATAYRYVHNGDELRIDVKTVQGTPALGLRVGFLLSHVYVPAVPPPVPLDPDWTWTSITPPRLSSSFGYPLIHITGDGSVIVYKPAVSGIVCISTDGGTTWSDIDFNVLDVPTGGPYGVAGLCMSENGVLFVSFYDVQYVYRSDDYGITWVRSMGFPTGGAGDKNSLCCSIDGSVVACLCETNDVYHLSSSAYVSVDGGMNWYLSDTIDQGKNSSNLDSRLSISSSGRYIITSGGPNSLACSIDFSSDFGVSFSTIFTPTAGGSAHAVSSDGKTIIVEPTYTGNMKITKDGGITWADYSPFPVSGSWTSATRVLISDDGQTIAMAGSKGTALSVDGGLTDTNAPISVTEQALYLSRNGAFAIIYYHSTIYPSKIYIGSRI